MLGWWNDYIQLQPKVAHSPHYITFEVASCKVNSILFSTMFSFRSLGFVAFRGNIGNQVDSLNLRLCAKCVRKNPASDRNERHDMLSITFSIAVVGKFLSIGRLSFPSKLKALSLVLSESHNYPYYLVFTLFVNQVWSWYCELLWIVQLVRCSTDPAYQT